MQTSQPSQTNNPFEGRGHVEVQDDGSTRNRTTYIVNDDGDDPLDLTPKKKEEEPKDVPSQDAIVTPEEETPKEQTQDVGETEQKPEEQDKPKYDEKFNTDLETVLQERTGVGLDGIVEAVTTLLSWYNDILSVEAQSQQQVKPQQAPKAPPTFLRSQGRETTPAAKAYDYRKSEILAMSPDEYARNAQRITNAYINGRVLND